MFKFLTHRSIWINLLAVALLAFLIIYIVLKLLGIITKHDSHLKVPGLIGKKTTEAIKLLEDKGFQVEIVDSIYTDTAKAGVVLKQLPDPNATVKVNRTIYLTVNRVIPPLVDMPKLEGQSLAFALDILERSHLKVQDTVFRPDFRQGSVIEQQFKGVRIAEKTKLPWGSKIVLVVGNGLGSKQFLVPSLVGMTYAEAKSYLEGLGIIMTTPITEANVRDTAAAYIYKQNPERFDENDEPRYIQAGQMMDVWLTKDKNYKGPAKDSTNDK